MQVKDSVALVTGANRGIGRAIVDALLAAGAAKVYAGARNPDAAGFADRRVVPVQLDVADRASIARLPQLVADVRILINNAGVLSFGDSLQEAVEDVERQFTVNYFGPMLTVRALAPVIEANGGGAIVNVGSIVSLASMPAIAGYSASKAALLSLTQAQRGSLAKSGISVHAVLPGPVDTGMTVDFPVSKASPADVARAVVAGMVAGDAYITPDSMAVQVYDGWRQDHRAVEAQFAAM
ncbi:MAG: SDR family oxidoreductase [Ancalomicrobiaceae bacterium]|nr:SDR family oxidoreductase [Ancalomicrobiaceae bacterium]